MFCIEMTFSSFVRLFLPEDATSDKWDERTKAENVKRMRRTTSSLQAIPTPSHMALVALRREKYIAGLISQNCDGLHRRSGFDITALAELHGNTNLEICGWCGREYFRDFSAYHGRHTIGRVLKRTMWPSHQAQFPDLINPRNGNHYTGRRCIEKGCQGYLFDSTIDFGDNLPDKHINRGFRLAKDATLCIVLGSRCSVSPACEMPISVGERGDDLVVVNLQRTAADRFARLRIGAKIDDVMVPLMKMLKIRIPTFELVRHVRLRRESSNEVLVSSFDMADESRCDDVDDDDDDDDDMTSNGSSNVVQNDIIWNVQFVHGSPDSDRNGSLSVQLNQDATSLPRRRVPQPGDRAVIVKMPWLNEEHPGKADVIMTDGACKGCVYAVSSNLLDVCRGSRTSKAGVLFVNSGSNDMSHRVCLPTSTTSPVVSLMFRGNYGEPPITLSAPEVIGKTDEFELRFDPMGAKKAWVVRKVALR